MRGEDCLPGDNKMEETPPVREDEIIPVTIEGIGTKGNPFAKINRFVIFINSEDVERYKTGSQHEIKITKVLDKFAFADPVDSWAQSYL